MKIGILGTGRMGSGLGRLWAQVGHEVMLGSRDPHRAKALTLSLGPTASGGSISDTASFGGVLVLAVPWDAAASVLKEAGAPTGCILIDVTNPLRNDGPGLSVGHRTSGAEEIARLVPDAKVVKAFNHIYWQNLDTRKFMTQRPNLFYCGDDGDANAVVAGLADELGFEAIDAGPLASARYLEPLAALGIQLANYCGLGPDIAFALLRAGEGQGGFSA